MAHQVKCTKCKILLRVKREDQRAVLATLRCRKCGGPVQRTTKRSKGPLLDLAVARVTIRPEEVQNGSERAAIN